MATPMLITSYTPVWRDELGSVDPSGRPTYTQGRIVPVIAGEPVWVRDAKSFSVLRTWPGCCHGHGNTTLLVLDLLLLLDDWNEFFSVLGPHGRSGDPFVHTQSTGLATFPGSIS